MNTIKPLPTYYQGHTFRSRLEARWAIVFDHLNIPWEYEKEGYKLPTGNYLPDFWLPTIRGGMWFEIKGQPPTKREEKLAWELATATNADVAIAYGTIPSAQGEENDSAYMYFAPTEEHPEVSWDATYFFQQCPLCKKIGFEFTTYSGRIDCPCNTHERNPTSSHIEKALQAGRTARFNNGHPEGTKK